ncbi:Hypothetical protein PFR_JS9-2_2013 [Propionibacterium freudenreichii]|nr:Hypothetical protein PFR_JS9-1_2015 [Propionibacterium freudenreichii]SCQ70566.1 Hypothetical protein PFR_JS9-2_2013 [Propionibacterium freudenreichii]
MRGELGEIDRVGLRVRITPAYAGRTARSTPQAWRHPDHPRVCGENRKGAAPGQVFSGSPPRMRGELGVVAEKHHDTRITPAYAGRTVCLPVRAIRRADHPRVCGENITEFGLGVGRSGSPPRMRGEPPPRDRRSCPIGITPAYAGRTQPQESAAAACTDHPRVCGENEGWRWWGLRYLGSPPRMRGERLPRSDSAFPEGITPAYAGRTLAEHPPEGRSPDHPRVCGENPEVKECTAVLIGSPPRMRGERHRDDDALDNRRITPAYAGRTESP